jgi:dethiobiotin synthetase
LSSGIFITGTDTGVGKTFVTAGIVRWLRRRDFDAVPMKPVQTGAERREGELFAADLEFSLKAGDLSADLDELRLMSPYTYEPACSPHLAGRMAGNYTQISTIRYCADRLLREHRAIIVEGAGGIIVPLNEKETMLDLMTDFGYPVVLVSRSGLGSINHALLSVQALRAAALEIAGLVFNQSEPPMPENSFIENDNPDVIARLGKVDILGKIGYLDMKKQPEEVWAHFERSMPGLERLIGILERG